LAAYTFVDVFCGVLRWSLGQRTDKTSQQPQIQKILSWKRHTGVMEFSCRKTGLLPPNIIIERKILEK
jgi:hypothetical protein